jgi:DNA-binding LacI/PurR family transcriptional regulator
MPATIRDVAKLAGVSKAAVSYVLNGRKTSIKITDETRNRILAAARQLNYHPNALARGLAHKRTDTVTLVMQYAYMFSGWSGFTNELMHSVSEAAHRLGYDLMLHTKDQPDFEREVAALTDGRADGALLLRDIDDPLAEILTQRGFPCVLFFSRSNHSDIWYVDCDNVLGGRMATEYLLNLGHRRIMYIGGIHRSSAAMDRLAGYESALRHRGIIPRPDWTIELRYADASLEGVEAILRTPDRPTAVFAWSDEVAVRLMTLARRMGLRIPEELSIVGFDSTELCNHTHPPLTSVRQPIKEMAARALEMLSQRIRGEEVAERQVLFPPTVVVRGSCAVPDKH